MTDPHVFDVEADSASARLRMQVAAIWQVPETEVRVVRAPYRLCPIGAHVDNQFGAVTALALEQALRFAFVPTADGSVEVRSNDFDMHLELHLDAPMARCGDWGDYLRGAIHALSACARDAGERPLRHGVRGIVDGALSESGLSSSAAVGIAYLLALASANDMPLAPEVLVRAQGRIEQGFLGVRNGLLDPAAVVYGRAGELLRVDTGSLEVSSARRPPAAPDVTFVAISSGQRAALVVGDQFNSRVRENYEAALRLAQRIGLEHATPRLGDLPRDLLRSLGPELPAPLDRRVRHFVTETERVDAGMSAWARGDVAAFGAAMNASAASSINDYETGSAPMRDLLELLQGRPGVLGARFSGAGYRGCCVALVRRDEAADVIAAVRRDYAGRQPALAASGWALQSDPADGAAIE